jgi:catechol 2,3-dioxygenase-like lactoylglutathione lyase family enzyme
VLGAADLVAFIPTLDLDAGEAFYGSVLGLRLTERTPFAVVFDAGGTQLRVTKVAALSPHPFTVLGWRVADITAAVAQLHARGVPLTRYDGIAQDDDGIWTAPDGAQVAWFTDPAGNTISLQQPPPA